MFCPECGKSLSQPAEKSTPPAVVDEFGPSSQPISAAGSGDDSAKKSESPSQSASRHGTIEKAREGLHRASSATREALADNVKRVEKIRQVSSTVIEEATYDPSLRFVLVALVVFVVFIILLVLSKVMG